MGITSRGRAPASVYYTINHNRTPIGARKFMAKLAEARYTINHNSTAIAAGLFMAKIAANDGGLHHVMSRRINEEC